jgi:curved DNA-binding protein CbpA
MLKCFRSAALISQRTPMMMRGFSSTTAAKKDYYDVLGLNKDATLDEIKDAYRNLAKKYHPDVNATGEAYQGDADKFRDVVEAYQVLSTPESRTTYDLQNQSVPDFMYRAQRMEYLRKFSDRGKDGNPRKEAPAPGSYAESKRKWLADERKKFNVNEFGRYRGGVPQKGKGEVRGNSMGGPGAYHEPLMHNYKINPNPDSQFVSGQDALAFKNYMAEDRYSLRRRSTWFQATVDYNYFRFENHKYGLRWLRNLAFFVVLIPGLAVVLMKARNRSVLKQAEKLGVDGKLATGIDVDGRLVVQTPSGIIKYTEETKKHHHH